MKIKLSRLVAAFAIGAIFLLSGCGMTSLIVTVNFGNPPKGGGACSGRGICTSVLQSQSNAASGVAVTLYTSQTDKNILVMTFSMKELQQKQPDQVQYFKDNGTYNFDGPFPLTDNLYAPLKLAPNARIDEQCTGKVAIKGDLVTVAYTYAHD